MIGFTSSKAANIVLVLSTLSSSNFVASNSRMIRMGANSLRWKNRCSFSLCNCRLYAQATRWSRCSNTRPLAFASIKRPSLLGRYQRVIPRCCSHVSLKSAIIEGGCDGEREDDKVIRSIQKSLMKNLIQPHMDFTSKLSTDDTTNNEKLNDDPIQVNSTVVLVVACSGGCDSVALFHSVLALTRPEEMGSSTPNRYLYLDSDGRAVSNYSETSEKSLRIPCELHVAHFNHEQRGDNSDQDEALVRKLCRDANVPIHCYSWSEVSNGDSIGSASPSTFSQDVARRWRRRNLTELLSSLVTRSCSSSTESISQRWGAILTAHHRDDAEETILLKLLRGAHLTNLSGMDDRSDGFELDKSGNGCLGYFAKPMLGVRKRDIVQYLITHGLEWREDESNSENKYKRNKVRNQVIPLLNEIAGGEEALQKRLAYLEQQSKDLSHDLSQRAEEYLESMSTDSVFLLLDDAESLDIVKQEAFHIWTAKVTNRKLILSYEQMQRIRNQFENYPSRLQWTLDVGDCWSVRRNGKALTVFNTDKNCANQLTNDLTTHECLQWEILHCDFDGTTYRKQGDLHKLHVGKLPCGCDISSLVIKQVKDVSSLTFIPPWRKGRSAVKIREFLRGQKIPLHSRDNASVLCCLNNMSSSHLLAVYLENMERWIVHSEFSCDESDSASIKVVLGKRPKVRQ